MAPIERGGDGKRGPDRRGRRVLAPFAAAALVAAAAFALARGGPEAREAIPAASAASGSFIQTNSKAGAAIFNAGPLGPGNPAQGSVVIRNAGTLAGRFRLEKRNLVDTPGPLGGVLSERLHLLVRRANGPTVYSGPLASMPSRDLGRFAAGQSLRYDFTTTIQDGGAPPTALTGDNAYKVSSAIVEFVWLGRSEDMPAGGPASPKPPANPSTPTTPGATTARPRRRDSTPPRLRVRVPRTQRLLSKRRIGVFVRCSERCRIRARGWMPDRSRQIPLRSRSKRLSANRRGRMYFRLSARARSVIRRQLRRGKQVTVRLRFTSRDRAGNSRAVIRRAHLRRVR